LRAGSLRLEKKRKVSDFCIEEIIKNSTFKEKTGKKL